MALIDKSKLLMLMCWIIICLAVTVWSWLVGSRERDQQCFIGLLTSNRIELLSKTRRLVTIFIITENLRNLM